MKLPFKSPRRTTVLCLEGFYYLAVMAFVFGGAIMREINLLLLLFGMMLGPLLYNWRSVVMSLKKLRVSRDAAAVIRAGDRLVVSIEASNGWPRRNCWAVAVQDRIRLETALGEIVVPSHLVDANVLFTQIPPGAARRLTYQGRIEHRGKYRFGPLKITTRAPLGLVRRTQIVEQEHVLIVHPKLGRMTRHWAKRRQEAIQGSRPASQPRALREGEFHSLRDWRPGDSRRAIHWRTTARRGELMVRQFEQQRNFDLVLLVDLWQPFNPNEDDLEYVESAVSCAATMLTECCQQGGSELVLGMGGMDVTVSRGMASPAMMRETLTALATAEAGSMDQTAELIEQGLINVAAGSTVVLLTTRPTDLNDQERFPTLWNEPSTRRWRGRILTIDTSGPELSRWFLIYGAKEMAEGTQ